MIQTSLKILRQLFHWVCIHSEYIPRKQGQDMMWVRQDPHVSSFLHITSTGPQDDPPTRPSHLSFWHNCDTGAARIAPETAALFAPALWGVTEKFGGQRCESASPASRDCSRVVKGVRWTPGLRKWAQPDKTQGNKQRVYSGTCATWLESNMDLQPCEALLESNRLGQRNLRIPTIATRSGTLGSRSCKFATSAHRPKCRVRRDPSHHSGRQH